MLLFLNPIFELTERRVGWRIKTKVNKGHVVSIKGTDVPDDDAQKMLDQNAHLVSDKPYSETAEQPEQDQSDLDGSLVAETLIAMSQHDDLSDVKMETLRGYATALGLTGIKANTSKAALVIALESKADELTA